MYICSTFVPTTRLVLVIMVIVPLVVKGGSKYYPHKNVHTMEVLNAYYSECVVISEYDDIIRSWQKMQTKVLAMELLAGQKTNYDFDFHALW